MRQHSIKWTENLLLSGAVNVTDKCTERTQNTHQDPNDLFGCSFSSQCVNPSITSLHVSFIRSQCAPLTNGKQNKGNKKNNTISVCLSVCECVRMFSSNFACSLSCEMEHSRDNRKIVVIFESLIKQRDDCYWRSVLLQQQHFKATFTFPGAFQCSIAKFKLTFANKSIDFISSYRLMFVFSYFRPIQIKSIWILRRI